MRSSYPVVIVLVLVAAPALGHDIPNARVDRSIQATLSPGRLQVDYEVSLSELTLTQDLRALVGTLPGGDRDAWFARYGEVTGPLNAKGLLVTVDGQELPLKFQAFDLVVEQHPRYTFHFEAPLPAKGKLALRDTNYVASEGMSRLAVRGQGGVTIKGDDLPDDVTAIPFRPVWQLSPEEEKRTKFVEVQFASAANVSEPVRVSKPLPPQPQPLAASGPKGGSLVRLLDRASAAPLGLLIVLAFGLGAAHSIQPGHGKSLVAAATIGDRGGWVRGAGLAVVITLAHMLGVLAVALGLWLTRSSRYEGINHGLTAVAGFVIAAIGFWRLGRHLAGHGEHTAGDLAGGPAQPSLLSLGIAGGIVPCWDAIVLVILAEAIGKLALGLVLLLAFSLGMASVLVAVGLVAARLRRFAIEGQRAAVWERRLGIASALALAAIGLYLLCA